MGEIGSFQEVTRNRGWSTEMLDNVAVKNRVYGLIELDVTKARDYIRGYRERTGETLSFTGWFIKCVAKAVGEDKQLNAFRKGRNRFVVFDDVDVSIVVEREVAGERLPVPYVIRRANQKSFRQIHEEIRVVQKQEINKPGALGNENMPWLVRVFQAFPGFLRKIGWWKFRQDPFLKKKVMGTVGVTAVGMFGEFGGWPVNIGFHSLEFALGGISRRQILVDGKPETREFLNVTLMFDHDVIDGAPAARFTARLAQLVQEGYGLLEQ
jgi:pyruvate/2-oxoglutarate dehydrogenase complex dihydrolipoamide acyltransferase (E2) component